MYAQKHNESESVYVDRAENFFYNNGKVYAYTGE